MPKEYCLHSVSAQSQHATLPHARAALICMLGRLEKLRPMLQRGHARVMYDELLEQKSLEHSQRNFLGLVNTLPKDVRLRWFVAIKNHAQVSRVEQIEAVIEDFPSRASRTTGQVPVDFISEHHVWMSFSGTTTFDSMRVEITHHLAAPVVVSNCSNESSLTQDWPVYEPSPKHRLEEYQRNGVSVSAMDLTQSDAQAALLVSLEFEGSKYVEVRGKIYRFIPTNPSGAPPTFHGFRVNSNLIPQQVFALLR